eukprot:TRINITY_DN5366_c0_g1_i2.p1 TRINITY_DN5366_c0_g1~~TRINITY_DN5366_c0_g1_i2.p1  ORF type:complete len:149 (-),score=10.90 TRINITY_DN5366_c0_g1_i2:316-762(-)
MYRGLVPMQSAQRWGAGLAHTEHGGKHGGCWGTSRVSISVKFFLAVLEVVPQVGHLMAVWSAAYLFIVSTHLVQKVCPQFPSTSGTTSPALWYTSKQTLQAGLSVCVSLPTCWGTASSSLEVSPTSHALRISSRTAKGSSAPHNVTNC